jgi:hypothetical protein
MLENSLEVRNRFVSKLSKKISKLNRELELLTEVDRKLLRQSGGGLATIQAKMEMMKKISENAGSFETVLKELKKNINDLSNTDITVPKIPEIPDEFKPLKNAQAVSTFADDVLKATDNSNVDSKTLDVASLTDSNAEQQSITNLINNLKTAKKNTLSK